MKRFRQNVDIESVVFVLSSYRQTLLERLSALDQSNGPFIMGLEGKSGSNNIDNTGTARDGKIKRTRY